MKDYVLELVAKQAGANAKLNIMREYLQAYLLKILHETGFFRSHAFLGGTALRFIYNLPRFSEDLDFSVTEKQTRNFVDLIKKAKEEFMNAGYNLTVSYKDEKTVQHAFFKFSSLLYEAGMSPYKEHNVSIKLEIDTNPPGGAVKRTEIVNKYFPVSFLCYDLSSLLAGKMHALMSRKYTKGRDYFDIAWYLSKWKDLAPNMDLLNNALKQTNFKGEFPDKNNWREKLRAIIEKADWGKIKQDVENFLENPSDVNVFTKEIVLELCRAK